MYKISLFDIYRIRNLLTESQFIRLIHTSSHTGGGL